jgi:hypothetical protein
MDASGKPSTVRLKVSQGSHYEEARAAVELDPGDLVMKDSAGKLALHGTSGGDGASMVVTEDLNMLRGKTIDDAYVADALTSYITAVPGDILYMWLADGENVVLGDRLISNGLGDLIKTTGTPVKVFATAEEALDLSGVGNTTHQRIRARMA